MNDPTIEELRREVRQAISESSMREVARTLEMSPTGLGKFAYNENATVYAKTLKKMLAWYQARVARTMTAPDPEDVAAAMEILCRDAHRELGPEKTRRMREAMAAVLADAYHGRQGVDEAVAAAVG
jgi:hypothetical protein